MNTSSGLPANVVIRVRETGIGIATNQRSRIFEMFTQGDTALERAVTGLGIGLTLVKTLTEMHGGTVDVTSAGIGQGTQFIVRLPIMMVETTVPPSARTRGPALTAKGLRILRYKTPADSDLSSCAQESIVSRSTLRAMWHDPAQR